MQDHNVARPNRSPGHIISDLREGNRRFALGLSSLADSSPQRRAALASGQSPSIAVLSCSDSRVPPELVFDQGLGDLFVVRVAGNVVDDAVLGSLRYAVQHLGVKMIIVLGHSACGAVTGACSRDSEDLDPATYRLLQAIEPAAEAARAQCCIPDELVDTAARINIEEQTRVLTKNASIGQAVAEGLLTIQGAWYDLRTGLVEWL